MTPAYSFPGPNPAKQAASGGLSLGTLRKSVATRPLPNPPHTAETNIVVGVRRRVVVAIGAPRVVGVVVPRAAPQHTIAYVPAVPKA